ncbi:BaiN/RdsA family NAD(P)/FAD-dependent oxidoreductase [Rubripirellula reticaptiva]|uniref:Putative FAD-binding dehydrogenase n=1 Tax=Rubripirellula reticaptiva TaxID=2528013 RepID=A0A5C6FC86_9BACT|nr:aminoacetone oxidase family FAD-binding enzyme [Rubripirellula reticaptiva]TWU58237.1 putative FAD-binding dehydrogenase [Rubripirellula reticaptiva]
MQIVVIGAGAAGLLAAAEAARRGAQVILLEKNTKTGVKILMSGGTRCNLTHNTDARGICEAFGHAKRFLQPSVGAFPPVDVVAMFAEAGVATKVESTGKIFPESNRAIQVRDALHQMAVDAGVQIRLQSGVQDVHRTETGWSVKTEAESIAADRVIVTAGGRSWPGCGTTGDAYRWLSELGHTIVTPRPALVPLVGGNQWMHDLSGVTLEDCVATVRNREAKRKQAAMVRRSSWLFTHFGFSGPAAMDVSGVMTAASSMKEVRLELDLVPEWDDAKLESTLSDRKTDGGRRRVAAVMSQWMPNRLADAVTQFADADHTIAELPAANRRRLIDAIKRLPIPVSGTRGFDKAEVTAGGVTLKEVDSRTMESRICKGLYIAGEVLDVDGWIGGYNFQAAFATGRAAAIAAAT